ncbi:MAG: exodeoxyribonuclease VII large subunit, partial [Desulfovibrio sp.]|nr:exodeoxyribonuclease VII large subunit [Desulfovibrio sp.]
MDSIFTVSGLTEILRETLERRVPFVWVRGEITKLSRPQSGHIYFSLKDSRSQLACVWFSARQSPGGEKFDPLTGEVFEEPRKPLAGDLRNGMEILCAGSIGVYAPRGQYQLLVELAQPVGAGELALQFERLKRKLEAAGFFAGERKRALPVNPVRIALVTSSGGAAIHDFLELAQSRGISSTVRLFPVPVQGAEAAARIAQAIRQINSQGWAQVIVLIRGGGSLEDLWAFNEEIVAQAIFTSRLPVLAGIGHEVDFTLADLTADVRAATPSHAAQLLWPERAELWQRLDESEAALTRAIFARLERAESGFARLAQALNWLSPMGRLERLQAWLTPLAEKLEREIRLLLAGHEARFNA